MSIGFHDAQAFTVIAIDSEEREFFIAVGERIALFRKMNNITRAQRFASQMLETVLSRVRA